MLARQIDSVVLSICIILDNDYSPVRNWDLVPAVQHIDVHLLSVNGPFIYMLIATGVKQIVIRHTSS